MALVVKNPPASAGDSRDVGLIPGSGRSPGRGHGNTLQCSCLENPLDRWDWRATVQWVAESDTTEVTQHANTRKTGGRWKWQSGGDLCLLRAWSWKARSGHLFISPPIRHVRQLGLRGLEWPGWAVGGGWGHIPGWQAEPGASPGFAVDTLVSSQWRSCEVFPHFTDEKTKAQKLSSFPKWWLQSCGATVASASGYSGWSDRWRDQPAPFTRDSRRLSYASVLGEPLILDKFRDVGHPVKRGSVSPFLIAFDFHSNRLLTLAVFWGQRQRTAPEWSAGPDSGGYLRMMGRSVLGTELGRQRIPTQCPLSNACCPPSPMWGAGEGEGTREWEQNWGPRWRGGSTWVPSSLRRGLATPSHVLGAGRLCGAGLGPGAGSQVRKLWPSKDVGQGGFSPALSRGGVPLGDVRPLWQWGAGRERQRTSVASL